MAEENKVLEVVRRILGNSQGCHDLDHTLRVLANAEQIAREELDPADGRSMQIVRLAALLHDCARPEECASKGKIRHEKEGFGKARKILEDAGYRDESVIREITFCVLRHRFRGEDRPETLPEKIIFDADKLDSIGAVGIGRAFHFAGHTGARLHNTEQEALSSEEYSREDTAFREYLVKLRHVPERMLTETGKRLAVRRKEFMDLFFRELGQEIPAEDGLSEPKVKE